MSRCSVQAVLAGVPRIAVSVNGVAIPHEAISREAQNHPAPTPGGAWKAAARALVVRELLLQEARRQGLTPEPESDAKGRRETAEDALIRALVERELRVPEADADTCRRYYEQNRRRFRSADLYEAAHILIAARRDRAKAYGAARERAEALIALLTQQPGRFAELAAAESDCPSGKAGGNLGQLVAGSTTPSFEEALRALRPGETTPTPVETPYGLHIVRLDRHVPGRDLPFEAVQGRIADYLGERSRRTATAQYLARLAARADVRGIDLPSAADMRVS
jgi:peptidyl-prolyl cis-trans isomerase C